MRDINEVLLVGTIGSGYQGGDAVYIAPAGSNTKATFTLVCTKTQNDKVWSTYIKVVAWNELADNMAGLGEGDRVLVRGEWRNNSFTNKAGEKIKNTEINAFVAERMSESANERGMENVVKAEFPTAESPAIQNDPTTQTAPPIPDDGDDLPF